MEYQKRVIFFIIELSKTKILEAVVSADAHYVASFGDKDNLPMHLGIQFAILTCKEQQEIILM